MADIAHTPPHSSAQTTLQSDLKRARDLFMSGGEDSDRQATEILMQALAAIKNPANQVPLDQVDSLTQLVHLLTKQGAGDLAGTWANTLYSSILGREEWLKKGTLQDAYVWASKGLAFSGRLTEALNVEDRFIQNIARRVERPGLAVVQSWFRSSIYHFHQGHSTRALIIATKASDEGWRLLRGKKEDAQMLIELLGCVEKLQESEGAPAESINRTQNRISETLRLLSQP